MNFTQSRKAAKIGRKGSSMKSMNKRPVVTVPGTLAGLLDFFSAPVYNPGLGLSGHAGGLVTPPYEDRPERIEVFYPSGGFASHSPRTDIELDLTKESGVARALFWLGDRLGLETADDRKLRSNPPHLAWDDEIGCWMLDDWCFGPEGNRFLEDCEQDGGFEPWYPSRFIKDLPAFDHDDLYSWHKALRALMLHVEASGVNQAGADVVTATEDDEDEDEG